MDFFIEKTQIVKRKLVAKGLYNKQFLYLLFVGIFAVSVFWNGAKIVQQNFELERKVAEIREENELLELENRNKELRNEYLKTEEFAELTARRVFGRAAPGEKVYLVPRDVAMNALSTPEEQTTEVPETEKPQWQENLEAWLRIYLGS